MPLKNSGFSHNHHSSGSGLSGENLDDFLDSETLFWPQDREAPPGYITFEDRYNLNNKVDDEADGKWAFSLFCGYSNGRSYHESFERNNQTAAKWLATSVLHNNPHGLLQASRIFLNQKNKNPELYAYCLEEFQRMGISSDSHELLVKAGLHEKADPAAQSILGMILLKPTEKNQPVFDRLRNQAVDIFKRDGRVDPEKAGLLSGELQAKATLHEKCPSRMLWITRLAVHHPDRQQSRFLLHGLKKIQPGIIDTDNKIDAEKCQQFEDHLWAKLAFHKSKPHPYALKKMAYVLRYHQDAINQGSISALKDFVPELFNHGRVNPEKASALSNILMTKYRVSGDADSSKNYFISRSLLKKEENFLIDAKNAQIDLFDPSGEPDAEKIKSLGHKLYVISATQENAFPDSQFDIGTKLTSPDLINPHEMAALRIVKPELFEDDGEINTDKAQKIGAAMVDMSAITPRAEKIEKIDNADRYSEERSFIEDALDAEGLPANQFRMSQILDEPKHDDHKNFMAALQPLRPDLFKEDGKANKNKMSILAAELRVLSALQGDEQSSHALYQTMLKSQTDRSDGYSLTLISALTEEANFKLEKPERREIFTNTFLQNSYNTTGSREMARRFLENHPTMLETLSPENVALLTENLKKRITTPKRGAAVL